MTTFEERLHQANLTPFKNVDLSSKTNKNIKDDCFKLLVKQLYKYQKFKNSVALTKINRMQYNELTVVSYMSYLRKYLAVGAKNKKVTDKFYNIIDELKAKHEAILTPSESDACKRNKPYKTATSTPSPTPPKPVETPKYIEIAPDQYGVKIQNTIKLYANKEACDAYIECYKEFNGDKPVEVVKVEFEYV